jgi:hypothetical protein
LAQGEERPAANIANIRKGRDDVMGQNSCQPEGLRPQSRLALSAGLAIFTICPAPSFAPSPILARNAHALHYVRHSKEWTQYGFEKIKNRTRYTLVTDEGRTVLRAEANRSASGVIRRMRVDPREYPLLRWSWKISNLLPDAHLNRKDGDDFPARIYVMFDYPRSKLSLAERLKVEFAQLVYGEALPLATLCYVWDAAAPVGTIAPRPLYQPRADHRGRGGR